MAGKIRFSRLDKSEKEQWLPRLFDLLYDNMRAIAPSGFSYEEEKRQWLENVSPALDKAPRQLVMCFVGSELAGYVQYYTRERLLMVEEIQIRKAYQRTLVFYRFCKFLLATLPEDIAYIEAYAERRNLNSQRIMQKLGMKLVDDTDGSPFVHLRGDAWSIRRRFR